MGKRRRRDTLPTRREKGKLKGKTEGGVFFRYAENLEQF